jgi:hypothetical protein
MMKNLVAHHPIYIVKKIQYRVGSGRAGACLSSLCCYSFEKPQCASNFGRIDCGDRVEEHEEEQAALTTRST